MYFEWTYTQFVSGDSFLNIILHNTSMFAFDSEPYISFCIYNRANSSYKYDRIKPTKQEWDNLFSMLRFDSGEKYLDFSIGSLSIQGTLNKGRCCRKVNVDLHDGGNTNYSKWIVLIPHGLFSGSLAIDNTVFHINAFVYQDQQFGTMPVQTFLDKWSWGVVASSDGTRCCFSVLDQDGKAKTIKWTCSEKSMDISIEKVFYDDFYKALLSETKHTYLPQIWNPPIKIRVNKEIPLRKRIKEDYDSFQFTYYRYICTEEDKILGASELMQIERDERI